MALVSYSDSEASDSEQENVTQPQQKKDTPTPAPPPKQPPSSSGANFQSIVDRSNPRKIRVALPEIKPETTADGDKEGEDGPARKKARIGGSGGGAFSGFKVQSSHGPVLVGQHVIVPVAIATSKLYVM